MDGMAKFNHPYTIKCQGLPPVFFNSRKQSSCLLRESSNGDFSGELMGLLQCVYRAHTARHSTDCPVCIRSYKG